MGRPRTKADNRVMIANSSGFWTSPDGVEHWAHAGKTRIRANHPFYLATQGWWDEVTSDFPDVEQATAAPGELRGEDDEEE